jgi:hypothetical protein
VGSNSDGRVGHYSRDAEVPFRAAMSIKIIVVFMIDLTVIATAIDIKIVITIITIFYISVEWMAVHQEPAALSTLRPVILT